MRFDRWIGWTRMAILSGVACWLACGDDTTSVLPPDPDAARAAVRQANTALENILYDQINGNPQHPSDVDFRPAYDLYQTALGLDANNLDAHFGAGVTGLLVLSSDAEVNAAYDEWKAYLDQHTPFEVPTGPGRLLGVPIGLGTGAAGLRLPFDLVPQSALALLQPPLLRADPQIGRIQDILRNLALPGLANALAHLQRVGEDPTYTFSVTPRMQGDLSATPAEIDQTDVLALRAGCSLLAAASRIAVSYRLGFAAYDSVNLVANLQRGSGWLSLFEDGATQMAAARTACLEATDDVDRSLTALLAETDSQDDDVIKIGPSDLARADVDSIRANLPNVRQALSGGYTRRDDWDSDSSTPETPLTIDLGHLFTSPVQDWKDLLPVYGISTERRARGYGGYSSGFGSDLVTVTAPDAPDSLYNQYSSFAYYYSEGGGPGEISYYGDEFLREATIGVLETHLAELHSSACIRSSSGQAEFSGYLLPGLQDIQVHWQTSLQEASTCIFIPVITWDAATFEAWTFPDPTLGGLLPQMTSTSQLMSTFGVRAEQWQRRWELDWSGY